MNQITLIGNLTKDPEVRTTPNGKTVCNFWVAVNKKFSKESQFIKVTAWNALAENCGRYLAKGSKVCVYGEPSAEGYSGKDGTIRSYVLVNADHVEFLNRVNRDEQAAEKAMENDITGLDFEDIGF